MLKPVSVMTTSAESLPAMRLRLETALAKAKHSARVMEFNIRTSRKRNENAKTS